MTLNTQWMWDYDNKHEGQIIGKKISAPTKEAYQEELKYYVDLIKNHNIDIVALSEIEKCGIAYDFKKQLGKKWTIICQKSRDSFTGQDVAILTRLKSIKPFSTFKYQYTYLRTKKIRPSKIISGVVSENNQKYLLVATHLISKRSRKNTSKRIAQAKSIVKGIKVMLKKHGQMPVIIMGDLNDTPDSKTLNILTQNMVNTANEHPVCSYLYRNKCVQLDYIIVSPSLSGGKLFSVKIPKKFSDHRAVIYKN
ncbi:MAG: endonuclease/exonuclease/phosphatase family protein [Methylococcales bacterium]|nr:endonuclease/exonuclease/phosphatase family protein [Methylococcales bacterium]